MSYSYRDQTHFRSSNEDKFDNQLSAKRDLKRRLFKLGCQVRWGLSPPREAKRRNIAPSKKVSKQSANSREDAKSLPQKKPNDAIPRSKRCQNSRQTREKTQSLPKRSQTTQIPSKNVPKQQNLMKRRKVSRTNKEAKRRQSLVKRHSLSLN